MISNFSSNQLSSFQAYSRLTVVAHVKGQSEGNRNYTNNKVSFKDFEEILEKEEVVNKSLAREVDQWVRDHSKAHLKTHNNYDMESKTMSYIEKAYRLGFVNENGHLYQGKL
ncbi:hypothetical protein SAMN04488134_11250 [Amphibacillus marinus]|uniref:Uncharacterized protein n=1 Tax=Amphibacillus marinus TaxID=872970 RepID=A0A1H8SAB0_9BACI|nr:hypothetical protein [Amphibacillus marinus]SEO75304.1 hypothetical protein SAMN04488134_11250 [Amphibacillus marinus]